MSEASNTLANPLPAYWICHRDFYQKGQTSPIGAVLVITGSENAGKTTLARHLSERTGYPVARRWGYSDPDRPTPNALAQGLDRGGIIVELPSIKELAEIEQAICAQPLHIHLRRVGDWLFDTIGHPLSVNILNAAEPDRMADEAMQWLAGFGLPVEQAAVSEAAAA